MLDVVEFEKRLNEWRMYQEAKVSCAPNMRRARLELERCNRLMRMTDWLSAHRQKGEELILPSVLRDAFWSLRRHFKSDWDSIGMRFNDVQQPVAISQLIDQIAIVSRRRSVYERKCRKFRTEDSCYAAWECSRGPFGKRAKGQ